MLKNMFTCNNMEKSEAKAIIDSLYPVGQPRWFNIIIHDQNKAMVNLTWSNKEELGFKVQAISCRDEFEPQVTALVDLKDEIISNIITMRYLYENDVNTSYVINELLHNIKQKFNDKIKDINSRTIKTNITTNEES